MKLLKRILKKEAGQALPMALILLMLGGFLVIPTLSLTATNLKANRIVEQNTLELYAADAGVADALWRLNNAGLQPPAQWELPETVNGGTVNIELSKVSDKLYKIVSTATGTDGHSTTVECYLEISGGLFAAAITVTYGDLYIEGSDIDGDIWVSGDFSSEDSTVTGTVMENQTGEFTSLDPEPYRNEALSGTILGGYQKISTGTTWNTPIYIKGDLKIEAGVTVTLNGTLWVEGSIHIEGLEDNHTSINGTGHIIAEWGDITIEYLRLETTNMPLVWAVHGNIDKIETNQYIKAIIYAPEGDINIEETDVIYGAVFGKTASLLENTTIQYPVEDDPLLGGTELRIRTYTIK